MLRKKSSVSALLIALLLCLIITVPGVASYDRQAAKNYGLQWWNSCNHTCGVYSQCTPWSYWGWECCGYASHGGDCANFVSQCLVAGGESYLNDTNGSPPCRGYPCGKEEIGAKNLGDCLVSYHGWERTCGYHAQPPSNLAVGDVLIYHASSCTDYTAHSTIVTYVDGADVKISCHSANQYNKSYTYLSQSHPYYEWLHSPNAVQEPSVQCDTATQITNDAATLNAEITDVGGDAIDERRFSWGTTVWCDDGWVTDDSADPHYGNIIVDGNEFSYRLTGLSSSETYYFQAWAHNSAGWGNSAAGYFTTSSVSNPTITNQWITPTSAHAGDTITFYYTIDNPNSTNMSVTLGAQIRKPGITDWTNDMSHDKDVTLTPGSNGESRLFTVPSSASPGTYDLSWVIFEPGHSSHIYDSQVEYGGLEISAQCDACSPGSPSPSNYATDISVTHDLSWSCSGGSGWDSFDVYFGTSSNPPLVKSSYTSTSYNLGTLNYSTRYYWKIVAKKSGCASVTGPVWRFDTASEPPPPPPPPPLDTPAVFRIDDLGNVYSDGNFYSQALVAGSADVAEWVSVSEAAEPGDVLELDSDNVGYYRKSRGPCSTLVAGVVSTDPGFVLGSEDLGSSTKPPTEGSGLSTAGDSALLALMGIVPVKVTNEGGPIQPGDLLVSSSTPGYAMRWAEEGTCSCGLVGKALESFDGEKGLIQVLLTSH